MHILLNGTPYMITTVYQNKNVFKQITIYIIIMYHVMTKYIFITVLISTKIFFKRTTFLTLIMFRTHHSFMFITQYCTVI